MKLLVFAHTPPPHHGQSYMVQLMLEGFGGDHRKRSCHCCSSAAVPQPVGASELGIECYHVNARLSRELNDIGELRMGKFFVLVGYCLQAIWCRYRYGVNTLYYVPAPGKRSALFRDWIVMGLCRPFFKHIVLHWHAAGLAKWMETSIQLRGRALTYGLFKPVNLSIVLSKFNRADAEKLLSHRIRVVSNGIPDPCPEFEITLRARRRARAAEIARLTVELATKGPSASGLAEGSFPVTVLYLAHSTREKGIFDTLSAVKIVNEKLKAAHSPLVLQLRVGGKFVKAEERAIFDRVITQPGLLGHVEYLGFVSGETKTRLLTEADVFCFPTYYRNENQPVNLIEAMAFGLPIVTTRWRSLPELFPPDYPGLVDIEAPGQLAEALLRLLGCDTAEMLRAAYLKHFTISEHLKALADALCSVESDLPGDARTDLADTEAAPHA
jgi:glycosyltransferase involved in cell wall biosynthesis